MAHQAVLRVDDADAPQALRAPAATAGWANDSRAAPRRGLPACVSGSRSVHSASNSARAASEISRAVDDAARTTRAADRPRSAAPRRHRAARDRCRRRAARRAASRCAAMSASTATAAAIGSRMSSPAQHHAAIDVAAEVLHHREALREIVGLGPRRAVAAFARERHSPRSPRGCPRRDGRWRCRACRSSPAGHRAAPACPSGSPARRPGAASHSGGTRHRPRGSGARPCPARAGRESRGSRHCGPAPAPMRRDAVIVGVAAAAGAGEFDQQPVGDAASPASSPAIRRPAHGSCSRSSKPELIELLRRADAIEIGMGHRHARLVIGLDQREGGARHVEVRALAPARG